MFKKTADLVKGGTPYDDSYDDCDGNYDHYQSQFWSRGSTFPYIQVIIMMVLMIICNYDSYYDDCDHNQSQDRSMRNCI